MLQYTLKRLALIPPTFFLVSIAIFMVLNLAPGRPGELGGDSEQSDGGSQRESYRLFKEQFNLDKPVLFNTRFLLDYDEAEEWVRVAHGIGSNAPPGERLAAMERIENYGNDLVRHLIPMLESLDPELRLAAVADLSRAAQLRYVEAGWGISEAEAKERNRAIQKTNDRVKQWKWESSEDASSESEIVARWRAWWVQNREVYELTAGETIRDFFLDTRFAKYWGNLLRLDFGISLVDRRPVRETLFSKIRYSLSLTLSAIVLAYLIAVPLGVFSAVSQGTKIDAVLTVGLFVLYSLPTFFTGTVLLRLLSEGDPLALFPPGGFSSMEAGAMTTGGRTVDILWHLVLPVVTYMAAALAALSRYARTGVIDVSRADYVRTARAKGLHEFVVVVKHAARNGMIPILTLLGSLLPVLVSGSVVIEVVFNIPGMGLYLFDSINLRDYNAVMGVLVMASLLTLFGILLSDLAYAVADPRITFD